MRKLLAYAGEYDESKTETDCRREGKEHAFEEGRVVLRVEFCNAQHRAVRGDERKEYAKRRVQRRQEALHRDIDELHKRGNYKNEHKGMDIIEPKWTQEIVVKQPRDRSSDRHHEHDRTGHAKSGLRLLGHAKKRAATQKAAQNKVVHKNRTDDND